MTLAPPSPPPATPVTVEVAEPFGSTNWARQIGERLAVVSRSGDTHVELKLHPAHLGRVDVQVAIDGDGATVQFMSASPAVREALEAALPRLREMFGDAGVEHLDVDVRGYRNGGTDGGARARDNDTAATAWSPVDDATEQAATGADHTSVISAGLVDTYV